MMLREKLTSKYVSFTFKMFIMIIIRRKGPRFVIVFDLEAAKGTRFWPT